MSQQINQLMETQESIAGTAFDSEDRNVMSANVHRAKDNAFQPLGQEERRSKNIFSPYSKTIYSIISLVLCTITVINYSEFREECPANNQKQCLEFIRSKLNRWMTLIIINSIMQVAQFVMLVKGLGHRWVLVCALNQFFYLFIFSEQTINLKKYIGAINLIHIVLIVAFLIVAGFAYIIVRAFKWNRKATLIVIIAILTVISFNFYLTVTNSCDYYDKGITGKYEPALGSCRLKIPPYCWYKVTARWIDLTRLINNCYLGEAGKATYDKYFSKDIEKGPFVGYPNSNFFTEEQRHQSQLQNKIFDGSQRYKTLEEAKNSTENFDIIFDSEKQYYHIEVRRNQTLVEERAKLWQEAQKSESPPLAKNLLLIYVDAISRPSFQIKLPKTVDFFKRRAKPESYLEQEAAKAAHPTLDESYQFYRYNAYFPWTSPNEDRMFYGEDRWQYNGKRDPNDPLLDSVFQKFKRRGYISGTSNSFCAVMSAAYDESIYNNMKSIRFDHEMFSIACDPNFFNPSNAYSITQGPYSMGMHCLYDRILSEYTAESAKSFFEAYKDVPKVYLMQYIEGHEGTGEVITTIDSPIAKLLNDLEEGQLLDDTIVVVFSDHGLHMHGFLDLIHPENVQLQMYLPGLFVSMPPKVNAKYRQTIATNQQALISAINLFHFFEHINQGDQYKNKHMGLLSPLLAQNCSSVQINEPQCGCKV